MLEINKISKKFRDFELKDISLSVEEGEYFVLLGESGAGKSVLLETIAGLISPDQGSVILENKDITREKIQHRGVGLVFQDHAVFPHLNVRENIAYSLHGRALSASEKSLKVEQIADLLSIRELLSRQPSTLSGGELQRVALARTLVQQPRILLLDEPLASLDSKIKSELRALLREIHKGGQTIFHVTHDYEEALALATRIAVFHQGKLIQQGQPQEVFHHPRSEFVAHFMGIKNFLPVTLEKGEGFYLAIPENGPTMFVNPETPAEKGFIVIRGEDILLSNGPVETSALNNFSGNIQEIVPTPLGMEVCTHIGIPIYALITLESAKKMDLSIGKKIWIHFKTSAVKFIPD